MLKGLALHVQARCVTKRPEVTCISPGDDDVFGALGYVFAANVRGLLASPVATVSD